jgi:hypothetical protein
MNTTDAQRANVIRARRAVLALTGYHEDDITRLKIEKAFDWLDMIGCTGDMQTQMASTKEFWNNFWLPEWHRLDVLFLNHHAQWQYNYNHKEWYDHFHTSPQFMNSPIVQAGYHQVIKEIVKAKAI